MGQKELQNLIESVLFKENHYKKLAAETTDKLFKKSYTEKIAFYHKIFISLARELDKLSKNN